MLPCRPQHYLYPYHRTEALPDPVEKIFRPADRSVRQGFRIRTVARPPVIRRLLTRLLAIVPAVVARDVDGLEHHLSEQTLRCLERLVRADQSPGALR